jgi:hypothetical protein
MKYVIRQAAYEGGKPNNDSGRPNGHFIDSTGEWNNVYPKAKLFETVEEAADYYRDVVKPKDTRNRSVFIVQVTVKEVLDKCIMKVLTL